MTSPQPDPIPTGAETAENRAPATDPAVGSRTLLHVFPTFAVGGSQVRLATVANHFGSRYRHLIVALDGTYDCREKFGATVDYRTVAVTQRKAKTRAGSLAATVANWRAFRRVLAEQKPDVLITYNWGAIEWAIANHPWAGGKLCPHIHIEDGFGPEEIDRQLRRRVLTRRFALAGSDRVVLPSKTLFDIAATVWRVDRRILQYLPNGIDCARFSQAPDPALLTQFDIAPGTPVVGTVAALRPEKNLTRMLDAFAVEAASTGATLLILGDGADRPRLESHAASIGIGDKVVFAGHVERPDRAIGLFDLFALSSDTEQMPYSVLEAMAAGLPVAGIAVGDVRQMVAAENARFIVDPGADVTKDLGRAMADLLNDTEARRAIGEANRRRAVETYDQAGMFEAYDKLFSEI